VGGWWQVWFNDAYQEYEKRLRTTLTLETIWHKDDDAMLAAVAREKGPVVCLDEKGKMVTSKAFSDLVFKKLEEGECRPQHAPHAHGCQSALGRVACAPYGLLLA
jgi:23S rRNA pseudoU1915 N3-methylase RlmH